MTRSVINRLLKRSTSTRGSYGGTGRVATCSTKSLACLSHSGRSTSSESSTHTRPDPSHATVIMMHAILTRFGGEPPLQEMSSRRVRVAVLAASAVFIMLASGIGAAQQAPTAGAPPRAGGPVPARGGGGGGLGGYPLGDGPWEFSSGPLRYR